MDFLELRKEYKKNRQNNKLKIKNTIRKDNVFTGSGGSSNIIVIHENIALKIIPHFRKEKRNNDQKEIDFYKLLFDDFIKTNITPHIVGIYENFKYVEVTQIIPKKCIDINKKLFIDPKKINKVEEKLCQLKLYHDNNLIYKKLDICVLENCNTNIEKELKILLQNYAYQKMQDFIHRTIFQTIFTLSAIQKKYPRFIHNDLFLRNILGRNETKYNDNDYVEYKYLNKSYYLKANGFYLKINDFGFSLCPPKLISSVMQSVRDWPISNMTFDDNKRDVFNFLYDYYDGANHGSNSVMKLLENKHKNTKKIFRNLFKKYIDVGVIDDIQKYNRRMLNHQWNIKEVSVLRDTVSVPCDYFANNVFDKYCNHNNAMNIVACYSAD